MQHFVGIVRGGFFVFGLLLASLLAPAITHAQTSAVPTIFCLGNTSCADEISPSTEPIVSAEPSVTTAPLETLAPTTATDISPEVTEPITEEPTTDVTAEPTEAPCPTDSTESTVSVQHWHHHHHHRKHSFSDFLRFLIDLINKLIEKLGGTPITIPTDPCITPEPTQGEEEPSVEPTTGDITTEPTSDVTAEPTDGTDPTAEPTTGSSLSPTGAGGTGTTANVNITFYGTYDNDPKGSMNIAHPVLHQQVGGVGTYADPLTFASPAGDGAYEYGQIIYVPKVQKYFIKEDECAVSWTALDGCGAVTMVDLYVGNPSDEKVVTDCENSLTDGEGEIIIDPPSNLTVSSEKIWDQATGTCMTLKQ